MATRRADFVEWPIIGQTVRRFWHKIEKTDDPDQCWIWIGAKNKDGYGILGSRNAHRISWMLNSNSAVPKGKFVLHSCDNRLCVNPRHLRVGTNADNIRDKVERGRSHFPHPEHRGANHPMAKLTFSQVEEMRRLSTGRRGEGKEFAERYGISRSSVCLILKGKNWSHGPFPK